MCKMGANMETCHVKLLVQIALWEPRFLMGGRVCSVASTPCVNSVLQGVESCTVSMLTLRVPLWFSAIFAPCPKRNRNML